jgi:FkbM family methyltransferase
MLKEGSEDRSPISLVFNESQNYKLQRKIKTERLQFSDPAMKICLFGAGNTGREIAEIFRKQNVKIAAFIDDTPHKQGTVFEGIPIYSRDKAFTQFGCNAVIVITIYKHGHQYQNTANVLRQIGFDKIYSFMHVVRAFPAVATPYKCFCAPEAYLPFQKTIQSAYNIMADNASREEYERQIRFRLLLDYDVLSSGFNADNPIYFDPAVLPAVSTKECIYVDCGAYDGDTVLQFLKWCNASFKSIIALEPDPLNYQKLLLQIARQPDEIKKLIKCFNAAVGATEGAHYFNATGGQDSFLSEKGNLSISVIALDNILKSDGIYYIKFDVEGGGTGSVERTNKYNSR